MENYVAKHDKLMRHLQMTIESASRDYAKVSMPLTENHKNGMGVGHLSWPTAGPMPFLATIEFLQNRPAHGGSPRGARRPAAEL